MLFARHRADRIRGFRWHIRQPFVHLDWNSEWTLGPTLEHNSCYVIYTFSEWLVRPGDTYTFCVYVSQA